MHQDEAVEEEGFGALEFLGDAVDWIADLF
jgi:hypothetical protein